MLEVKTEKFCGVDLFNWKNWDYIDDGCLYFYNVQFLFPSMQKYNGMDVARWFDGKMKIYGGNYAEELVWSGYITDILEVMDELNKRKEN